MDRKSSGPWRVALLCGGRSPERQVSLASGRQVASALRAGGHRVRCFDPVSDSLETIPWHRFDVCFLALHGGAGEDGRVQGYLAGRGVAFTGSGPAASRRAMHKAEAKRRFRGCGVPTPEGVLLRPDEPLRGLLRRTARLGLPLIVKPNAQGSSLGISLVHSRDQLPAALAEARRFDRLVLAEQHIAGRELTVAVLGRRPLPVLEVSGHGAVFDYHAKYSSPGTKYGFADDLEPMKLQEVQQAALKAAEALGTEGLVRVDLMLDQHQRSWVLELNTLPGMTETSLVPKAAARAGWTLAELCDWMLQDALARTRGRSGASNQSRISVRGEPDPQAGALSAPGWSGIGNSVNRRAG